MARKADRLTHELAKAGKSTSKQSRSIARQAGRGFSLIEVLVSMSLFASCLLTLVSLQLQAQRLLLDTGLTHQALAFASSYHERKSLKASLEQKAWAAIGESAEEELRQSMPGVLIKSVENKGYQQLELFWPSHHQGHSCALSDQADTTCIRM